MSDREEIIQADLMTADRVGVGRLVGQAHDGQRRDYPCLTIQGDWKNADQTEVRENYTMMIALDPVGLAQIVHTCLGIAGEEKGLYAEAVRFMFAHTLKRLLEREAE